MAKGSVASLIMAPIPLMNGVFKPCHHTSPRWWLSKMLTLSVLIPVLLFFLRIAGRVLGPTSFNAINFLWHQEKRSGGITNMFPPLIAFCIHGAQIQVILCATLCLHRQVSTCMTKCPNFLWKKICPFLSHLAKDKKQLHHFFCSNRSSSCCGTGIKYSSLSGTVSLVVLHCNA